MSSPVDGVAELALQLTIDGDVHTDFCCIAIEAATSKGQGWEMIFLLYLAALAITAAHAVVIWLFLLWQPIPIWIFSIGAIIAATFLIIAKPFASIRNGIWYCLVPLTYTIYIFVMSLITGTLSFESLVTALVLYVVGLALLGALNFVSLKIKAARAKSGSAGSL